MSTQIASQAARSVQRARCAVTVARSVGTMEGLGILEIIAGGAIVGLLMGVVPLRFGRRTCDRLYETVILRMHDFVPCPMDVCKQEKL